MKKCICILLGLSAALTMASAATGVIIETNRPARWYVKRYVAKDGGHTARTGPDNYNYRYEREFELHWLNGVGGSGSYGMQIESSSDTHSSFAHFHDQVSIPASGYPPADCLATQVVHGVSSIHSTDSWMTNTYQDEVLAPQEHCDVRARVGPQWGWPLTAYGTWIGEGLDPLATGKFWRKADATVVLETGGKAKVRKENIFSLNATAEERTNKYSAPSYKFGDDVVWSEGDTRTIAPTSIKVDGKALGSDGRLWRLYPDNTTRDITPKVRGTDYYSFTVDATKHRLIHETVHPALTETNLARTKLGVGEYVNFWFDEPLSGVAWPDIVWTTTGGRAGTTNDVTMQFTAPSNAANVTVSVTVKGQKVKEKFKVVEPSGVDTNRTYVVYEYTNATTAPFLFGTGNSGAGMHLRVFTAPTDVSFYRIECMEVGEDATGVTGYYTNNPPWTTAILTHKGGPGQGKGDEWFPINEDNSWDHAWDYCWWQNINPSYPPPLPWAAGGFTWNIPGKWRIPGGPTNNLVTGWNQKFTLQADGTMKIEKFGRTVTRHPSSP